jgi:hypothetical protein
MTLPEKSLNLPSLAQVDFRTILVAAHNGLAIRRPRQGLGPSVAM